MVGCCISESWSEDTTLLRCMTGVAQNKIPHAGEGDVGFYSVGLRGFICFPSDICQGSGRTPFAKGLRSEV